MAFSALAVLTCLLFLPALEPGTAFFFRDVSQNHEPFRQFTTATLLQGEAPLWNPYRGTGQPLLANPNTLVLHPTTLLFLLLPLQMALKLSVVAQILLAAGSTWLLLRDMGTSRMGALVGACSFAFSGYMVSLGNLINLLDSVAFMPLSLWLLARAMHRRFSPWGILAACSLAVQLLAGGPAILVCTALCFLGLHWSFSIHHDTDGSRSLMARFAVVAAVVALAVGIAMVGLLPGLELLVRSERSVGFDEAEILKWSLPPSALIETILPGYFGDPTRIGITSYWGGGIQDGGLPFILSIHVGMATLMLAVSGAWLGWIRTSGRRKEIVAFSVLGAGGLVMALGRFLPIYPLLVSAFFPLESVRYPVKYFLMTTWVVSLLAARGYDEIHEDRRGTAGGRRPMLPAVSALMACSLAAGLAWVAFPGWLRIPHALATPEAFAGIGRGIVRSSFAGILEGGAMIIVLLAARVRPRMARIGLAVVPIGALVLSGVGLNPVTDSRFYTERPLLSRKLGDVGHDSRLWAAPRPRGFAFRTPSAPNTGSLVWGFRWDRMTLRNATYLPSAYRFAYDRGNERLDVTPGALVGRRLYGGEGEEVPSQELSRMLSIAGVEYLITYGNLQAPGMEEYRRLEGESNVPVVILRNTNVVPRVRVVHETEIHPRMGALRRLRDPSFDLQRVVILEEADALTRSVDRPRNISQGSALIIEESATRVRIRASAPQAGYLVLADTYYPGWKATVDARAATILRANAMFRAVALEPGEHEVVFTYRPSSLTSGGAVSAATILLALFLAVPRRR